MTEEQLLQKSNPRVIAFQGAADAEQEMALAGAHPEGVRLMSAAAGFVTS